MTTRDRRPIIFDHIAIGVPRAADATPFLVGELGGESLGGGPSAEFAAWQWRFRGGGCLEIIEPEGPPGGFMHRFLERRGPGIHHVTFKVPSLPAICRRAEELGYSVVGYDDSDPTWMEAFLHPREALGLVVQFAESHPELRPEGEGWGRHPSPPEPTRAARTATLVGLRLVASDEDAVRRQWQELLQGSVERQGSLLVARWPESPLRLAVELDPDRLAGPRFVELAAGDLGTAEAERAELGTRFVEV